MSPPPRWERCVSYRGTDTDDFVRKYFAESNRQIGLICGAGFDPRSTVVAEMLSKVAPNRVKALFLREERPGASSLLSQAADENDRRLQQLIATSAVVRFDIFDPVDNAPVGSRRAIQVVREHLPLDGLTDVVIDCSAISVGVCFSIIKYWYELAQSSPLNVHLMVLDHPATDGAIEATHCGQASSPQGFHGEWRLDKWSNAAKLWLPQLGEGKRPILEIVHKFVVPHAVCPILPFPATDPRYPDRLIEVYGELFDTPWEVDSRDIVYAHEKIPLDLYRSILRIDDARRRVFAEMGGSQIILSPAGSKALALGMLMAALERNFAVVLVESLAYNTDATVLSASTLPQSELVYIWLSGDAYMKQANEKGYDDAAAK